MSEETKTSEEEPKTVSFPGFLNKIFECLFNQNVHLHRALAQVLQEEFKKQEERHLELEEKINVLEKNLKEGFLHYTREIIKGLDATTQALLDTIAPPLDQIPPSFLQDDHLQFLFWILCLKLKMNFNFYS